jgi:GxxExxY protein
MIETSSSAISAPLRDPSGVQARPLKTNDITAMIVDVAIHIHRRLGPGLLESVYQAVLAHELRKRGLCVEVERPIPVEWDDVRLEVGFRADLIVEDVVVVELKSCEGVAPVHKKVLLTYRRLTDKRVGLLINFGAELLKDGIHRVVNEFREEYHAEAQSAQSEDNRRPRAPEGPGADLRC